MRNNWFEIWHFYSNLVVFATIKTMSNKKGEIFLVTHNQECKKKKKKKNVKYMLFFSRHETCLFILATLSCNFQFVKTRVHTHTDIYIYIYSMIKSVRGRDLNLECFYWKLRYQSVKLQDFWYNLLKYWRKLIISCTAYRAITQLILNNISILEFKS